MAIVSYVKLNEYQNLMQQLSEDFQDDMMLNERFLLDKDVRRSLEIYYAPFEYVNERAKVIIVGITPGLHQMRRSYETILNYADRMTEEAILQKVKDRSSFHGSMRTNLVTMLDQLGLHEYLGIESCGSLFAEDRHLLNSTSLLPYPVFYKGRNYSGSTPSMLKTPILKQHIETYFIESIHNEATPLVIPLGVKVELVLLDLIERQKLPHLTLLAGFPHPSGSNGHRFKQFDANRTAMERVLAKHFV